MKFKVVIDELNKNTVPFSTNASISEHIHLASSCEEDRLLVVKRNGMTYYSVNKDSKDPLGVLNTIFIICPKINYGRAESKMYLLVSNNTFIISESEEDFLDFVKKNCNELMPYILFYTELFFKGASMS